MPKIPVYSDEKPGASPLGVVPRNPEPDEWAGIFEYAATELGFLTGVLDQKELNNLAAQGEEWEWEDYQLDYLEAERWYCMNKSRQTGASAAFGAKGFSRGILSSGNYTGIYVSYKKEEAISKVRYVRSFLEALPLTFKKKIIRDPLHLIEWENPNHTISRIISHAQKPIRGHHGDVFLDEFAFFQQDQIIYESALPIVTQVNGSIDIASTPFGKGGMFYEIMDDKIRYPEFDRHWIYWWECLRYLKDPTYEGKFKAMLEAPHMSSEERVKKFGNHKILTQFHNLDIDIFKQEFEGFFVDELASFFPRNLILACMFDNETHIDEYAPRDSDFDIPIEEALAEGQFHIKSRFPDVRFKKYETIEELSFDVARGAVSANLYCGVDVGATIHSTDIRILEEIHIGAGKTLQVERFSKNIRGWKLPRQEEFLRKILSTNMIRKLVIDGNGIGMQMGQSLKSRWPAVVHDVRTNGSSQIRNRFIINLRNRMMGFGIAMCYDRQLIEDLHCIQSVITQQKNQRFITDEKKLHHGDGGWALAFASLAGTPWGLAPKKAAPIKLDLIRPGWSSGALADRAEDYSKLENKESNDIARRFLAGLQSNRPSANRFESMFRERRQGGLDAPEGIGPYHRDWDK